MSIAFERMETFSMDWEISATLTSAFCRGVLKKAIGNCKGNGSKDETSLINL